MSHYTRDALYELLPAVLRQRDAEAGHPLRDFVAVLAGEAEVVERDVRELYANWFIETCADWVVPYVGDLVGVRGLSSSSAQARLSRRAEIANTLRFRQRKGTAGVLEQLARDVTGWPARAVEFFERLGTTQSLNHVRPHSLRTPDLRRADELELVGTPFSSACHTFEARRIQPRRGCFNIPNVGLFLWRLGAYPMRLAEPRRVAAGQPRFTFSPLGNDAPLFHLPATETDTAQLADELNVPGPIRRRIFRSRLKEIYGVSLGVFRQSGGEWQLIPVEQVVPCNLEDWNRPVAAGTLAIDPLLGRFKLGAGLEPNPSEASGGLRVTYHYGFSDDLGGGRYEREATFSALAGTQHIVVAPGEPGAAFRTAVVDALDTLAGGAVSVVVVVPDSRIYPVDLSQDPGQPLVLPEGRHLEIRAANGERPTLRLAHPLVVDGGKSSTFELNGLLVSGAALRMEGELDRLTIQHTTLVPGLSFGAGGQLTSPGAPSLEIATGTVEVILKRSILGPLAVHPQAAVEIADGIVDGGSLEAFAYEAEGGGAGGSLSVQRCTVVGRVHTRRLDLAESSIFLAPVVAEQRQNGCVRFSHVPLGSRVPRRYRCQPEIPAGATPGEVRRRAARVFPRFTSLAYGEPGYGQLHWRGPAEVYRGSEDESEMGAFSSLLQPQREDSLRVRLDEYLRLGLEAGIFFVT